MIKSFGSFAQKDFLKHWSIFKIQIANHKTTVLFPKLIETDTNLLFIHKTKVCRVLIKTNNLFFGGQG